jgi:hypothetical protein
MRVHLYITDETKMKARIRLHNNTQWTEYLYLPRLFPEGHTLNNHFQFEPRENVTYVGPEVKRKPFAEEDLITLLPAEIFITDEIDLKAFYLISDRKKLKVRYRAFHPLNGFGKGDHMVESAWENLDNNLYFDLGKMSYRYPSFHKPRLEI